MKISEEKKKKISEQILAYLFSISPRAVFTVDVAKEIVRDEEFTKKLLLELNNKKLVTEIKRNSGGIPYSKRSRWRLSDRAYKAYKENL
ncbi:MAG: hypothetical protein ABEI74_02710 [Candidatus Pacearchaeota archaeon]